jgi:hypothetical protein
MTLEEVAARMGIASSWLINLAKRPTLGWELWTKLNAALGTTEQDWQGPIERVENTASHIAAVLEREENKSCAKKSRVRKTERVTQWETPEGKERAK